MEIPRKTGRPRLYQDLEESLEKKGFFRGLTTRRGRLNALYQMHAALVLQELRPGKFSFLGDLEAATKGDLGRAKKTILTELGRIPNKAAIVGLAELVCRRKLKARPAAAIIRSVRLGQYPPPDPLMLGKEIARTVQVYIAEHPGMTEAQVAQAFRAAAEMLSTGQTKQANR